MKQNESNIQLSSNEQMAMLFGKGRTTITEHICNIFEEGELQETVVCRNFRHTTKHGAVNAVTHKFGNSEFSTKLTN